MTWILVLASLLYVVFLSPLRVGVINELMGEQTESSPVCLCHVACDLLHQLDLLRRGG